MRNACVSFDPQPLVSSSCAQVIMPWQWAEEVTVRVCKWRPSASCASGQSATLGTRLVAFATPLGTRIGGGAHGALMHHCGIADLRISPHCRDISMSGWTALPAPIQCLRQHKYGRKRACVVEQLLHWIGSLFI